jgi:hypothetical protein
MSNELVGAMFFSLLMAVVGLVILGDSEGVAKRKIFWQEGDSPESYKAIQKAVVLFGTILLVAGIVCLLLSVVGLILKSSK